LGWGTLSEVELELVFLVAGPHDHGCALGSVGRAVVKDVGQDFAALDRATGPSQQPRMTALAGAGVAVDDRKPRSEVQSLPRRQAVDVVHVAHRNELDRRMGVGVRGQVIETKRLRLHRPHVVEEQRDDFVAVLVGEPVVHG
jgi:hypothetical protein